MTFDASTFDPANHDQARFLRSCAAIYDAMVDNIDQYATETGDASVPVVYWAELTPPEQAAWLETTKEALAFLGAITERLAQVSLIPPELTMIPNRAPSTVWLTRRLGVYPQAQVTTAPNDMIDVMYFATAETAPQWIGLPRKDARLLAKRISQCLDATVRK